MTETETTAVTVDAPEIDAKTITDSQIDEFFDNGGKFKDPDKPKKAKKAEKQPEVVETPEKEAKADEATQPEEEKKDSKEDKKVNYGALHEERQRRKAEAARASKIEAEFAEYKAKYQPQQQQYQPQNPLEVIALRQQQIDQYLTKQEQDRQKQAEDNAFREKYSASAEAFKQDAPDFTDAYNFLVESRLSELQTIGWSPEDANRILVEDEKGIVNLAYQNEVNPAERIYNLAKMRGYQGKQAEPQVDNTQIEAKLDTIIKGQMSNKTLPPASKAVSKDLTAEAIAAMDIDVMGSSDFDSAWNKLFGRA